MSETAAIGTLRQFAARLRDEYIAEEPGCTKAEYDRCYPPSDRAQEWVNAIRNAAAAGRTIAPRTLDALYRYEARVYWSLHHDYPSSIPAGYLNPGARAHNDDLESQFRAARKLGRARADAEETT